MKGEQFDQLITGFFLFMVDAALAAALWGLFYVTVFP